MLSARTQSMQVPSHRHSPISPLITIATQPHADTPTNIPSLHNAPSHHPHSPSHGVESAQPQENKNCYRKEVMNKRTVTIKQKYRKNNPRSSLSARILLVCQVGGKERVKTQLKRLFPFPCRPFIKPNTRERIESWRPFFPCSSSRALDRERESQEKPDANEKQSLASKQAFLRPDKRDKQAVTLPCPLLGFLLCGVWRRRRRRRECGGVVSVSVSLPPTRLEIGLVLSTARCGGGEGEAVN